MKLFVMVIRDRAIDAFMTPFFVTHIGSAERGFIDAINNDKSEMAKHPEDYDLYQLGTYDDGSGMFEVGIPRQISVGKAVVKGAFVSPVSAANGHSSQVG